MSTCRLFHDWDKWEDITMMVRPALTSRLELNVVYSDEAYERACQKKVCKRCGKKKVRGL